jgi:hypothetical protein
LPSGWIIVWVDNGFNYIYTKRKNIFTKHISNRYILLYPAVYEINYLTTHNTEDLPRIKAKVNKEINAFYIKYTLIGFIIHYGSAVDGGHYYSYVLIDNILYKCDDSIVSISSENYTDTEFGDEKCGITVLLYENKSEPEHHVSSDSLKQKLDIINKFHTQTPFSKRINEYINS